MAAIRIAKVIDNRDLQQFIDLPRIIYRESPHWAPPIWRDERKAYSGKHNPILANSEFILFLALRNDETVGRILAYVDHSFNTFYQAKIGFFGAFECIDDQEASSALFIAAEDWNYSKGMTAVRGPINPVAEHWGFLLKGFDSSPVFLSPYNPPHYNLAAETAGYRKVKDLLAYEADTAGGYLLPERFATFHRRFMTREPGYTVRRINLQDIPGDAEIIWRLSNESLHHNWGYVPVDRQVMQDMIKRLKPILDPDAVWFVEHHGEAVGYCLGFPDLNRILRRIKGKLFPLGMLHLLFGIKRIRHYRLFALAIHPSYHSIGLDVLLYIHLYNALGPKNVHLEANYILEDNSNIKNALIKLGMRQSKIYRVYEKSLYETGT